MADQTVASLFTQSTLEQAEQAVSKAGQDDE